MCYNGHGGRRLKRHSWQMRPNRLRWCTACGMHEETESVASVRGDTVYARLASYFVRGTERFEKCGACPGPVNPPPTAPQDPPHDPVKLLRDLGIV